MIEIEVSGYLIFLRRNVYEIIIIVLSKFHMQTCLNNIFYWNFCLKRVASDDVFVFMFLRDACLVDTTRRCQHES